MSYIKINSHPARARRRTERLEWHWVLAFYQARRRGIRTIREARRRRADIEYWRQRRMWADPAVTSIR